MRPPPQAHAAPPAGARRLAAAALLVAAALAAAPFSPARAAAGDDQRASELFRAGAAAYARADYTAAARAFEEAHRRAPHGAALYNAGLAWQQAKDPARAADAYEAALKLDGLTPEQLADTRSRLGVLEKGLGHLLLGGPPAERVSVGTAEHALLPLTQHLPPGAHTLTVTRGDGRREPLQVAIVAGGATSVTLQPLPPPPLAASAAVAAPPPAGPAPVRWRRWGWAGVALAGACSGVAIVTGLEAWDARDRYNASGHTDIRAYQRASSLRTWTNVLWVSAGIAGAAGVTLLLSGRGDAPHTGAKAQPRRVALTLWPAAAALSISY